MNRRDTGGGDCYADQQQNGSRQDFVTLIGQGKLSDKLDFLMERLSRSVQVDGANTAKHSTAIIAKSEMHVTFGAARLHQHFCLGKLERAR